jgi:hypothetical protein
MLALRPLTANSKLNPEDTADGQDQCVERGYFFADYQAAMV